MRTLINKVKENRLALVLGTLVLGGWAALVVWSVDIAVS